MCLNKDKVKQMLNKNFVNLTYMKYHGGHTLERHVYISDKEMNKKVSNYNKNSMTKYNGRCEAEKCFREIIDYHCDDIVDWVVDNDTEYLILNLNHERPVGYGIKDNCRYDDMTYSKAKLVRDTTSVLGFSVQTMFPTTLSKRSC